MAEEDICCIDHLVNVLALDQALIVISRKREMRNK